MPANASPIPRSERLLVRNIEAWSHFEAFLVAAVSSFLGVRLALQLSGYPQLGGHGLHIAHMLWGGLMMLLAIIMLIGFLSRAAHRAAAVVGGFGFGLFIDEVGKFVTSDNNYFFQPAISLIYIAFVGVYLVIHTFRSGRIYSRHEYLVNALQQMEEVAMHEVTTDERARALFYLDRSDPANPLVPALREALSRTSVVDGGRPSFAGRVRRSLAEMYRRVACSRSFERGVTVFFIARLAVLFAYGGTVAVAAMLGRHEALDLRFLGRLPLRLKELEFADAAQLVSSAAAALFTFYGVVNLGKNRRRAFEMFERSLLVAIFVTRVFVFYEQQFLGLVGLAGDLLLLIAVRFVIEQEKLGSSKKSSATQPARAGRDLSTGPENA